VENLDARAAGIGRLLTRPALCGCWSSAVAPPGFCNRGGGKVWVYRGSRVRSPPVPVVLSVYQRVSLLDGLAMHLSCDTKKFHDNESTHILHNFWTSTHRGGSFPLLPPLAAPLAVGIVASVPCIDNPDTHAFSGMEMVPSI